jgi:anaerobic ribonucleoside-triphosphate reductase
MKAYFINAKHEYIVELNVRDYEHKKELIEANLLELYPYQINGNDIWTDEEAQLKEYSYNFVIDERYVVHGNAIITSVDDEGESTSVKNLTVQELISRVRFLGKQYVDHSKLEFKVMEWN